MAHASHPTTLMLPASHSSLVHFHVLELGRLSHLNGRLALKSNLLSLAIPTEVGNFVRIRSNLELGSNQLGLKEEASKQPAVPTQLGRLSQLVDGLSLGPNSLNSFLPTELGLLTEMDGALFMASSLLYRSIPTELGTLTRLESLELSDNSLRSVIPTQLAQLSCSSTWPGYVDLSFNNLCGDVPTELGYMIEQELISKEYNLWLSTPCWQLTSEGDYISINDTQVDLRGQSDSSDSQRRLTGTVPTEFGLLTTATKFDLMFNRFTATLPTELGAVSKLVTLYLGDNSLAGSLPTELGSLVELSYALVVYDNELTSSIPTELGNLVRERWGIELDDNMLVSSIPTQLGRLPAKMAVYLDNNALTNTIPSQLGNLEALLEFDLKVNSLSSTIPTQLGKLVDIESFSLAYNSLCGDVPVQVAALSTSATKWNVRAGNEIDFQCDTGGGDGDGGGGSGGGSLSLTASITLMFVCFSLGVAMVVASRKVLLVRNLSLRGRGAADLESGRSPLLVQSSGRTGLEEHGGAIDDNPSQLEMADASHREARSGKGDDRGNGLDGSAFGLVVDLNAVADIYMSWKRSSSPLVVLDQDLRIVLWSAGMCKVRHRSGAGASVTSG